MKRDSLSECIGKLNEFGLLPMEWKIVSIEQNRCDEYLVELIKINDSSFKLSGKIKKSENEFDWETISILSL